MLYQGDAAKYRIADRMREAERSRLANEVLAARKRDGGLNGRGIPSTLLAVVTWPIRQLTRLPGASVGSGKTSVEVRPAIAL